jgi:hypothetical protein
MEKRIMTPERADKILAKFKPLEDQAIKEGKDCLEKHLGKLKARLFLEIYVIRSIEESRGKDYTKWRQENPPEEDPELMALLDDDDREYMGLNLQSQSNYVHGNTLTA